MPDHNLIESCSPTLAGLKTASMINVRYDSREHAIEDIREMNHAFKDKGLKVVPLRFSENRALVYIYRPEYLRRDIANQEAQDILGSLEYPCGNLNCCISHLAKRIRNCPAFPHEVGLFLGYPPEDVRGFIKYHGRGCKLSGPWKVYGDADKAKKKFEQFGKCRDIYRERYRCGSSICDLTVRTTGAAEPA